MPMVLVQDPYLNRKIKIPLAEITKSMRLNIDIISGENYWSYDTNFPFINLTPPLNQEALDKIKIIHTILQEVEPHYNMDKWKNSLLPDFDEDNEIEKWLKIAHAYHEMTILAQPTNKQKQVIYNVLLKSSWSKHINKKEYRKYIPKRTINLAIKTLQKIFKKQK